MGSHKQGVLGGFRGKVGPIVGSSWKGINIIKAKPISVANPRTAGQIAQRNNMSAIVILSKMILATVIKPLWDRFAQKKSGYNAFVQSNIGTFISGVFTNFDEFVISMGKMAATEISSIVASRASNVIRINWNDDSGQGFKLSTDKAFALVYNQPQEEWYVSFTDVTRSAESISVVLGPNAEATDTLRGYLAFRRSDGTIVSNTVNFIGTVAV